MSLPSFITTVTTQHVSPFNNIFVLFITTFTHFNKTLETSKHYSFYSPTVTFYVLISTTELSQSNKKYRIVNTRYVASI